MLSRLPQGSAQISGTGAVTIGKIPDPQRANAAIGRFKGVAISLSQFAHKGSVVLTTHNHRHMRTTHRRSRHSDAQAQLERAREEASKAKDNAGQVRVSVSVRARPRTTQSRCALANGQ